MKKFDFCVTKMSKKKKHTENEKKRRENEKRKKKTKTIENYRIKPIPNRIPFEQKSHFDPYQTEYWPAVLTCVCVSVYEWKRQSEGNDVYLRN